MKTVSIDLSEKPPMGPVELSKSAPEKYYPSVHLEGVEIFDLPKSGTLKIKYKKTHSEKTERDGKPPQYSCTLEVRKIVGVEARRPQAEIPDRQASEAALDALAAALMNKSAEDEAGDDYDDDED